MTDEEIDKKFRSFCRHAVRFLGAKRVEDVIGLVTKVEDFQNVSELTEVLARGRTYSHCCRHQERFAAHPS